VPNRDWMCPAHHGLPVMRVPARRAPDDCQGKVVITLTVPTPIQVPALKRWISLMNCPVTRKRTRIANDSERCRGQPYGQFESTLMMPDPDTFPAPKMSTVVFAWTGESVSRADAPEILRDGAPVGTA